METCIGELKKKDVVNLKDGRKLGRIFDVVFLYPEGRVLGVIVPGSKKFCFVKKAVFIDIRRIVRIGEDTVLVDACYPPEPPKKDGGFHSCMDGDSSTCDCPPRRDWDGVE